MAPPATQNYTQPAECKYASENIPTIPGSKFSTLVPLYQEDHHGSDMSKILESCCSTSIWFYEDPQPCTAVCTASSDAKAQDVQYCLNAREVNYGGDGSMESNAGVKRVPGRRLWAFVLFGGLVFSAW